MTKTTTIQPLFGVTVLEAVDPAAPVALSIVAGMCGRIARDLGARVISLSDGAALEPGVRQFLGSGKEVPDVGADLPGAVQHLLSDCQGIITDIGLRDRLALPADGPDAIALAMSCDAPLQGSEFTIEARSGLLDMIGEPDREPLRLGGHQLLYAGGLSAYLALIDALSVRASGAPRSDRRVDVLDVGVWLNWKTLGAAALGLPVPHRAGASAEWPVVPCRDGFVALVYRSSDWESFKVMLGDPRLDDARFATDIGRRLHRQDLNAVLEQNLARFTRAEVRVLALRHRLPLGPAWTPRELLEDEHMQARRFFQPYDPGGDALRPRLPVVWGGNRVGAAAASTCSDRVL